MSKTYKWLIAIIVIIIIVAGIWYLGTKPVSVPTSTAPIKVGIITDLTGPAAYWGESTRVGAEIAKKELEAEGYKIDLVFEDYQLDATKSVSSAQKLVNLDNVQAIYSEFNPAAIAVESFLRDKQVLHIYDAAPVSPLAMSPNVFKTYIDYQAGCKLVAQKFKDEQIKKIATLLAKAEFSELCLKGAQEVYPDIITESYELGDTDLHTQVLKIKNGQAGAIINVGFEGDTLNTFKALKDLKYSAKLGTVDDTITDQVKAKYANELKGAWSFGFGTVDSSFEAKLKATALKPLSTEYGAAIAYTHLKQIVKAFAKCQKDLACVDREIANSPADRTIGFRGFKNQIADIQLQLRQY
ncbi:MAG: ABC transporter substrate-binding protein [Candidatus Paceibacterota bacterium]|jgi:branched-chain amino acid transport system substrate-binding protein